MFCRFGQDPCVARPPGSAHVTQLTMTESEINGRADGLFDDNVDLNPPFAPNEITAALRAVKVRGRRRRMFAVGPIALVMGSGLAFAAYSLDLGGSATVTQIGSDLGSSAALAPETGSGPQGSSVLRDGSSVGDSYSSGPTQIQFRSHKDSGASGPTHLRSILRRHRYDDLRCRFAVDVDTNPSGVDVGS